MLAQTIGPKKGHQVDVCLPLCRIMWDPLILPLGSGMGRAPIDTPTSSSPSRATTTKAWRKAEELWNWVTAQLSMACSSIINSQDKRRYIIPTAQLTKDPWETDRNQDSVLSNRNCSSTKDNIWRTKGTGRDDIRIAPQLLLANSRITSPQVITWRLESITMSTRAHVLMDLRVEKVSKSLLT